MDPSQEKKFGENTIVDIEGGVKVYHNLPPLPFVPVENTASAQAMPPEEMKWTTAGGSVVVKPYRAHRGLWYKFMCWLVATLLPGFHITENPPKGIKRTRKERATV